MANYEEISRVEADSPLRCQASTAKGQCLNKATTEGGTCLVHGGNSAVEAEERKSIRNYQLSKWQSRLNRHADSPKLKTLNDEVAILRMMLEEKLNQCHDDHDLMLNSHLISDLVVKIEKLVKSCHSLESSLGGLMGKQDIMEIAVKIIEIISNEITDEDILTSISNGILEIVEIDK